MKKYYKKILKSDYFSNISVQVLGTGFAQVIPLIAMPFLSRMYTESDFASYTFFMAMIGVLSVAVGARYQYAIVLPKLDLEAYKIFVVSIYYTLLYSLLLSILLFLINLLSKGLLQLQSSEIIIPLYVFIYGIWLSIISLSIRLKKFKINSYGKVLQSSLFGISSLSMGACKLSMGLIIAKFVGVLCSIYYLKDRLKFRNFKVTFTEFRLLSKKYKDFPLYGILPSFLDAASLQAPVFVIGKYFTDQELGYYGLTVMALAGPLSIISVSFRDVFYQKIAEMYNSKNIIGVQKIFKNSALALSILGLPILIVLFFFGEPIFKMVFGNNWGESGKYASILIASFIIKLVVSPLSTIFNVINKLKIVSMWQITYFITTFLTFLVSILVFNVNIVTLLKIYLMHELILYLFYFILQCKEIYNMKIICAE